MFQDGDLFCLIGPKAHKFLLTYKTGGQFVTQDGRIKFEAITDAGMVVETNRGVPYHVIIPTAADLSIGVKRQTTISYSKDMGFQILNSTMASGSTVLECGGGSGGFTTILARFIGDAGRVHVFERRAEFIELAQKNLARVGLEHRVTWHHRDPSLDGFAVEGVAGFDAAFIDVPEPWTLIKPAWEALKPGCSLTSLSPNVEQVRRTVEAMHQVGFGRIWTVETLERELLVRDTGTRPREMMRSHTGYLSFGARLQPGVPAEVEAAGEAGESDNIDENANTEG